MHQRNWAVECSPWSPTTFPILSLPHADEDCQGLLKLPWAFTIYISGPNSKDFKANNNTVKL